MALIARDLFLPSLDLTGRMFKSASNSDTLDNFSRSVTLIVSDFASTVDVREDINTKKKLFNSGIARKGGGVFPYPNFLDTFF